jgi:geranyl-CoA carboxylase beta subunit
MPSIESGIDRQSEAFQAQRQQMLALIDNFRGLEGRVRDT